MGVFFWGGGERGRGLVNWTQNFGFFWAPCIMLCKCMGGSFVEHVAGYPFFLVEAGLVSWGSGGEGDDASLWKPFNKSTTDANIGWVEFLVKTHINFQRRKKSSHPPPKKNQINFKYRRRREDDTDFSLFVGREGISFFFFFFCSITSPLFSSPSPGDAFWRWKDALKDAAPHF